MKDSFRMEDSLHMVLRDGNETYVSFRIHVVLISVASMQ